MKNEFKNLDHFVRTANKGEEYVYHTGHIVADGVADSNIKELATRAKEYWLDGKIDIFQRRNSVEKKKFDYTARRIERPEVQRRFEGCYSKSYLG